MFTPQHKFSALLLRLALLFCATLTAQEQRPLLVAVLDPVSNQNVTQMIKMTVTGTLEQYIVSSKKYRVVDRVRTTQVLAEHGFARNGLVDNSEVKEIGKMLQADVVCVSELQQEKGYFIAKCSLIDVSQGEVFASAMELIASDSPVEIKSGVERVAMTLLGIENAREVQAREKAIKELAEREMREQEARERAAREQALREQAARKAAQLAKTQPNAKAPSPELTKVSIGTRLGILVPMDKETKNITSNSLINLNLFGNAIWNNGWGIQLGIDWASSTDSSAGTPYYINREEKITEMSQKGASFDVLYCLNRQSVFYFYFLAGVGVYFREYTMESRNNDNHLSLYVTTTTQTTETLMGLRAGVGFSFAKDFGGEILYHVQGKTSWIGVSLKYNMF